MNKHSPIKRKEVLAAFKTLHGHIAETCRICDIDRRTFNSWMETDADFREGIEDIKQAWLDTAEAIIRQAMDEDDVDTAKWVLARLGKSRGYSEKQEVEHKSLSMSVINIVLSRPEDQKPSEVIDISHVEVPPTPLLDQTLTKS